MVSHEPESLRMTKTILVTGAGSDSAKEWRSGSRAKATM